MAEFQHALKMLNMNLSNKSVTRLFQYLDSNGNGSLDYNEFLAGFSERPTVRVQRSACTAAATPAEVQRCSCVCKCIHWPDSTHSAILA